MAGTQLYTQFPWVGGLNTTLDPAAVDQNELVQADHLVFGVRGSRKKREGIDANWDNQAPGGSPVIGLIDYWYGTNSSTQARVGVTKAKGIYTYTAGGVRSADLFAGTVWSSAITDVSLTVFNNLLIIAVDGNTNVLKKFDGTTVADLDGTPPQASVTRVHQGRLFTNDKTNRDRLHYSPVQDHTQWNGSGDSGAIDIGKGDGDPDGITAIFPTFKGDLFVAKRTKLYRISGDEPENWVVTKVSDGIGCISHNSVVAVDQDEVFFVSERGVHSLTTTDAYGDFSASFLSKKIQDEFNTQFTASRRRYIKGVYIPTLNSVAFAVTNTAFNASYNNTLYLYNIELGAWYRWPQVPCDAIAVFRDADAVRPYLGRVDGKVAKTQTGNNYDTTAQGDDVAVNLKFKTGRIHLTDMPFSIKGFKKVGLIYGADSVHTIDVDFRIDRFEPQPLEFDDVSGDLLGIDFVLGSSQLATAITAPHTLPVDGYGRGFSLTVTQSGVNERIDIQGFQVEFEPVGLSQEVL